MADVEGDVLLPSVDLDKSYDIDRTFSASDLPAFEGLFSDSMTPSSEPLAGRESTPFGSTSQMGGHPIDFQVSLLRDTRQYTFPTSRLL